MHLFPTRQWLADYDRLLSENAALSDLVSGLGSPGDVLFVVQNLPLEETTVSDLPEVVCGDLPPTVREGLADLTLAEAPDVIGPTARENIPPLAADLLEQLETNVHDGDIYVRISIDDGESPDVTLLETPEIRDSDTIISGSCSTWQQITAGRPALTALMTGELKIKGNGLDLVQYGAVFQLLGDIAADVETEHVFADPHTSFADAVFDEVVRQPIAVQRTVQRSVTATVDLFTPF